MQEKPPDFNWVTERANCSAFAAFKELARLAKDNTAKREATLTDKDRQMVAFRFEEQSRYFAVIAENVGRIVRFFLRADQIEISGHAGESSQLNCHAYA